MPDGPADSRRELTHEALLVASHELRHPLHAMSVAIVRHLPEGSAARADFERYLRRMTRLTDDLVDFVRLEEGTLALHRQPVDLHILLVDLVEDYRSAFESRDVRLSLLAPTRLVVDADTDRLMQVLSNLLANALKFTPAGGAVAIEARRTTREISISITDTGCGLSDNYQSRQGRELHAHGLGVGLAVSHRILELHGGSLTVRSEGVGRGTEAVVSLPVDGGAHRSQTPQV